MLESMKNILSYIPKILQIILFAAIFLLALKNTDPIMVDVYVARFQMPLIILMVTLLMIGMLMGFLLTIPRVYRLKQKLKQISKDLNDKIAAQSTQNIQPTQTAQTAQTTQTEGLKPHEKTQTNTQASDDAVIGQLPPQP